MESEIIKLQKRVAELELALAAISKKDRRSRLSRRASLTMLICAVIGSIVLVFTFTAGASSALIAQGPSKVTAPFQVVDSKGHLLFSVSADPGTGSADVLVWNKEGRPAAEISDEEGKAGLINLYSDTTKARTFLRGDFGIKQFNPNEQLLAEFGLDENNQAMASLANGQAKGAKMVLGYVASDQPNIQILQGNNLRLGIGTGKNGDGLMVLKSGNSKANLTLEGTGIFQADNKDGKTVVSLGPSGFGGGDLHLRNNAGKDVVGIFSEQGQTGIAQLFNAAGDVRVTLGTSLETGKGDVCVNGDRLSVCVGGLFKPY